MAISNKLIWLALAATVTVASCNSGGHGAAAQDSVFEMCSPKPLERCLCAAKALKEQIEPCDYSLYEAVGRQYLANQDAGMERSKAWDEAISAVAEKRGGSTMKILRITNNVGQRHNKAIRTCDA